MSNAPADLAPAVDHYENFPVASWLCPPALRPAVRAIYAFARSADDIADEGTAPAPERLAQLARMRAELAASARGEPVSPQGRPVFGPLALVIERHQLPLAPFNDLLSAFEQDVRRTDEGRGYADRAELLDYCRRSADPIGRLLLHLYRIDDAQALAESDGICSALQLINFWQDLSLDLPRGRYYLPAEDCRAHGMDPLDPAGWPAHPGGPQLIEAECRWARELMQAGSGLVHRLPGRIGWELRLVVQGGLRILDRIAAQGFDTFRSRPRLHASDAPLLLWRAWRMEQSRR